MPCGARTVRVEYTPQHDRYLVKYLAKYCPTKEGRSGQKIYRTLVADEQDQWPWAVHHTAQSWRERYVKNSDRFDAAILDYQRKHCTKPGEGKKRAAESTPIETLGPPAKRAKREGKERVPSSETPTEQGLFTQDTNPAPTPTPSGRCAPQQASPEPELTRTYGSTPRRSTDATETQPVPDPPSVQTRDDMTESVGKQIPPPTDEELQQPLTLPRPTKRFKERPRASSDIFASGPSTPQGDAVVTLPDFNAASPSSQTRPTPSAPCANGDDASVPIDAPAYPCAPPRLVNTFQGQVMVDRKGHVPRLLTQGEKDALKEEEEEAQDKTQWPPVRGRAAKHRVGELATTVDAPHPFDQPIVPPRPEAPRETGEQEPGGKLPPPTGLVPPKVNGALDLHTVTHGVAPDAASQRHDVAPPGASPVKRVVPPGPVLHTPPPDLVGAVLAKWQRDKPTMFPPPRASTRSPFRPESSPSEARHDRRSPPQLQSRPQPQLRLPWKTARHPALVRLRRETTTQGGRNGLGHGKQRERRRSHASVPSVDLVALSRSSISARSRSRSSPEEASRHTVRSKPKPQRWSFPEMMGRHADAVGEEEDASGSGSGSGSPLRWAASEWDRGGALWTSSPTRSFARPSTSFSSLPSTTLALAPFSHPFTSPYSPFSFPSLSPSSRKVPHAADMSLAASHGLASMLARMSANHGMAPDVVEAVYARVGSLKEADEVLKGMREAAEGWGEREIERLVWSGKENGTRSGKRRGQGPERERGRTRLRYVVASEDGEGSEYWPPETSRAAMWKRYSESASHAEDTLEEQERGEVEDEVTEETEEDGDDEDEEEDGRQVEKELQQNDEEADEVVGTVRESVDAQGEEELAGPKDWLSVEQVITDNLKAQELERILGKARFQRELVSRFR